MIESAKIIEYLGLKTLNGRNFDIINVSPIFAVKEFNLTYIYKDNASYLSYLEKLSPNVLVILNSKLEKLVKNFKQTFILSETPKQDFVKVLKNFFVRDNIRTELIHKTAIINEKAVLHPTVSIGAYSIIGECEIGENSIIYDNVTINDKVKIGKNVKIYSGCKIGTDDFGPVRFDDGSVEMFPQLGGLIIEDNVEIFPMTCIGKGTLGITHIKKGVKIDHQCQIGHNSIIGENTVITAQSIICGSTKIGKNCYIGVNSVIRNENQIGDSVIVGMGSMVTKNFGDNLIIYGNPAKVIRENKEIFKF